MIAPLPLPEQLSLGIGLGLSLGIAYFLQVQNEMYALEIGLGIVFYVNFDAQNAT